jgi:hypothetical protein
MFYHIHFRPASHSDNHTIVATFKTSQQAKCAAGNVRQLATVEGKKVIVALNNEEDGTTAKVERVFAQFKPQKLEAYNVYQELKITVKVVAGASLETLHLIMSNNAAIILIELLKRCPVEITHKGKFDQWVFNYRGAGIFFGDPKNHVQSDFEFDEKTIILPKEFRVRVLKSC